MQRRTAVERGMTLKAIDEARRLLSSEAFTETAVLLSGGTDLAEAYRTRLLRAIGTFTPHFGSDREIAVFSAPGRTELGGNHTDHQRGHVLAASINLDVIAVVARRTDRTICVKSEGFPADVISLDELEPVTDQKPTAAELIRGAAAWFQQYGCPLDTGFDAYTTSQVMPGSGLSSSAAFEVLLGNICNALYADNRFTPVELAQMGQYAENVYFHKPCGLMDQAAVCLGGLAYMDFEDQAQPKTQKLELNFEDHGYALVLVKVGADHVAATDDYAAVPREMQDVAAEFGKARLCEVNVADFDAKLPELRAKLGDRACLRAVHYWYENGLVDKRWAALNAGDIDQFLVLTRESGASSAMYLQNVVAKLGSEQPSMYALALAEHVLDGRGAVRIHGGGFGGTIQAFVPLDLVDNFIAKMNGWLGEGSARHYAISDKGAYAAWL